MKLAVATLVLTMAMWAAADEPRPSSCVIAADKQVPVKVGPGRAVYCGLDLGSRSAKLSIVSMERGRPNTIREERICKRTLGMGALVFDSKTGTARPLPPDAIASLAVTINEYKEICTRDGGTILAAGATQWARDATNIADVAARVKEATGIRFDVLSPTQEADYSYVAGSVRTPGRIVLDAGSNSFELAWQEKGPRPSPASWCPTATCAPPPTTSIRLRITRVRARRTSGAPGRRSSKSSAGSVRP